MPKFALKEGIGVSPGTFIINLINSQVIKLFMYLIHGEKNLIDPHEEPCLLIYCPPPKAEDKVVRLECSRLCLRYNT